MKPGYNRETALVSRLNRLLSELAGKELNIRKISLEQSLRLKSILSNTNNLITLQLTISFVNWLAEFLKLPANSKAVIMQNVLQKSANSNGYDVEIDQPKLKLLAEIKGIVPINEGSYYGAAQRNGILDDALKLEIGKGQIDNPEDYVKIIGLLDIGPKTDEAIKKLLTPASKVRTQNERFIKRHYIVTKMKYLNPQEKGAKLDTKCIYITKIPL